MALACALRRFSVDIRIKKDELLDRSEREESYEESNKT